MKLHLTIGTLGLIAGAALAELACAAPADTTGNALPNLAGAPAKPRFKVVDKEWPANPGDASVCLWQDDKLAAFSITIDDNSGPDVEWWLEQSKAINLPLTWFIITGRVNTANKFWGDWPLWQKVKDAGHDVESHTVTHLHTDEPGWQSIEWEYADSIKQVEAGLNGHKMRFLAYPGGANSKLNDPAIAAKYFLAARGTTGSINPANQINYLSVNAMSGPQLDSPDPKKGFADVRNLLKPGTRQYRGWAVLLFHLVNDKPGAQRFLDFYKENSNDLWGGKFGDVAMYGQERDTATLKTDENTAQRIAFTLTDQLDDSRFAYPLSVKVRLPEAWQGVTANQNGRSVDAKLLNHEGGKFALVKAVPDKGQVVLTASK